MILKGDVTDIDLLRSVLLSGNSCGDARLEAVSVAIVSPVSYGGRGPVDVGVIFL